MLCSKDRGDEYDEYNDYAALCQHGIDASHVAGEDRPPTHRHSGDGGRRQRRRRRHRRVGPPLKIGITQSAQTSWVVSGHSRPFSNKLWEGVCISTTYLSVCLFLLLDGEDWVAQSSVQKFSIVGTFVRRCVGHLTMPSRGRACLSHRRRRCQWPLLGIANRLRGRCHTWTQENETKCSL